METVEPGDEEDDPESDRGGEPFSRRDGGQREVGRPEEVADGNAEDQEAEVDDVVVE